MNQPQRTASEGAKKAANFASENIGSLNEITEQIQKSATDLQERAKEYSDAAVKLARKYPVYATVGVLVVGFVVGMLMKRRD